MKPKKIPQLLYTLSVKFYNSIVFYPIIISAALFIASIFIVYLETTKFVTVISDEYGFLLAEGFENGRVILTTVIAGIISLTVFSFSMVMIVLNQAASSFSPRIIPGVITKKSHQVVLGFYIGTIIYSLILIHSITPESAGGELPRFGIFIAEFLAIFCLSLFVYFIHSISKSIQIDNIMVSVKDETVKKIKIFSREADFRTIYTIEKIYKVSSLESGYFRSYNEKELLKFLKKNNCRVRILIRRGEFILYGSPFMEISKKLSDEETEELLGLFYFHEEEFLSENFLYGFKQLTEVAVKALSPGINDPGTAVTALHYITILLAEIMVHEEWKILKDDNDNPAVAERLWSFEDILQKYIGHIRVYGSEDPIVMLTLLDSMLMLLRRGNCGEVQRSVIKKEISAIIEDADSQIGGSRDRELLNKKIDEINTNLSQTFKLLT